MKVLMTAEPVSGVLDYAVELCQELSGLGVEIVLATIGRALSDEQKTKIDALSNLSLFRERLKAS